jgi:ABC-type transport system substrate-binding protein
MVYSRYTEQVKGLRAYAAVSEIPADPYDVPVSLAKRLIGYRDSIKLSSSQQAVYDQAKKLLDEHGPKA